MGFPQGEFLNWYFEFHCGMTFKYGAPVNLPGNPMDDGGDIADASVSDSAGTLLFFSQGLKLYNRDKVVMPNGSGLKGGEVACQVMAVQDISNHNLYYLFTLGHMDFQDDPDRVFRYSVIDMQLDGGNGDIVPGMKNIPLQMGDSAQIGLYATRHQNNRDAWVVVLRRGVPIKQYLSFLIDSSGVSHTPVVSVSTLKNDYLQVTGDGIVGPIRISPDGKYLFCTDSLTELCLFNTSTGVVTPKFRFWPGPGNKQAEGQEFSIDSRYVYFTTASIPPDYPHRAVVQFDMLNTDSISFMNSRKIIGDSCGSGIQMAPDGKIYVATYNASLHPIHRINNPSDSGISCNYQKWAFDLQGFLHWNFPQFLQRYKAYLHHSSAQ
jgi:large repetitive protein